MGSRPSNREQLSEEREMGKMNGKVAFVTGAARGQGRSHAVALARAGADVVVLDLADQIDTVPYPMSTPGDLAETARSVEALDRRCVAIEGDVRSLDVLTDAVAAARSQL